MMSNNFFRGDIYHCIENNGDIEPIFVADGLMVVDSTSGRIIDIGSYSVLKETWDTSEQLVHFKDRLIMPGFIDTHVHYPQYKVIASYGTSLLEWLNKYTFIEEQKFSDRSYADQIANFL